MGAITPSTYEKYHYFLGALCPSLGKKRLEDVRPQDIESAYKALKLSGGSRNRPWSGTSVRTAHNCGKAMFRAALEQGLVNTNPFDVVKPPRLDTKMRKALRPSDAHSVLAVLDCHDTRMFCVSMMLRTGMRAKECLGVLWSDVTDEGIRIRRDVTKTDAGVRTIPLDLDTREYIECRRNIILEFHTQLEATMCGDEHLCCYPDGRALTYNALKHWWARSKKGLGLDGYTLHEMRHSFLTNLAQAGIHPSVMQRLAGHSSMRTTLEIYTHAHLEDMQQAVDTLSKARKSAPKSAPFCD